MGQLIACRRLYSYNTKWTGYANEHAGETGGKEWRYVLVPHDAVGPSATLAGLVARYQIHAQRVEAE
jgi:hypothetical protein